MKEEKKEQSAPKFEDLLTEEEKAKKETTKKIRELEKQKKQLSNQNDFKAAMSMAVNISD